MGMELRIREPSTEEVAPFRLLCAELSVGDRADAFLAGVSRTSFRNCELFIVLLLSVPKSMIEDVLRLAYSLAEIERLAFPKPIR
jgi:hypothetical protein